MTTTTILELNKPAQGDSNWHTPINANFQSIDDKLGKSYKFLWNIDDITYITTNAKYVTDHWERWDNTKAATLIKITGSFIESYYCNVGTGTITWIISNDYFGDGSDGAYSASSNTTLTGGVVKQYTTFKDNGYTVTVTDNTIIYATESITISGNITLSAVGGTGGSGYISVVGTGNSGDNGNITYGGSGGVCGINATDAAYGISGSGGTATDELETPLSMKLSKYPSIYDNYILKEIYITNWGSGGGAGGAWANNNISGGDGGNGSGILVFVAPNIIFSGTINAVGEDGEDGTDAYYATGGGGGGGGGVVMLFYNTLSETGTINVNGGSGGTGGVSTQSPTYDGEDGTNGEDGTIVRIEV